MKLLIWLVPNYFSFFFCRSDCNQIAFPPLTFCDRFTVPFLLSEPFILPGNGAVVYLLFANERFEARAVLIFPLA